MSMKYHTRVVDTGGTIVVPPARLVAIRTEGGTVALHNRGNVFTEQDYTEPNEPFVVGPCRVLGSPGTTTQVYFRF